MLTMSNSSVKMQELDKFRVFNLNYNISRKDNCQQLYEDLNGIGIYADQIFALAACDNSAIFFRNQFKDIQLGQNYNTYTPTTIGNLAISLAVLDESDLKLKQNIYNILADYQNWLYTKDNHCAKINMNCSLL